MSDILLRRREFLRATGIAVSALPLVGCNAFDGMLGTGHRVRGVLEQASDLSYRVQRILLGRNALAEEFPASEIRQGQRPNGSVNPTGKDYLELQANAFTNYQLGVTGLVERPQSLSLENLHAMPARSQITRHDCVEGWSCIAKWTGVPLSHVLDLAVMKPQARYVVFHCFDTIGGGLSAPVPYYESIDLLDARHPQTILAYGLNDQVLPVANGAPLRLRVERQLGYKMAKYVRAIEVVDTLGGIGGGKGGYWEDLGYDWYAGI